MDEADAIDYLTESCTWSEPMSPIEAGRVWRDARARTLAAARSRIYRSPSYRVRSDIIAREFMHAAGGRVKAVVEVDPEQLVAFQFYVASERSAFHAADGTWATRCLPTRRSPNALQVRSEGNSMYFDVPHGEHILMLTPEGELRIEQNHPYVMVADIGDGRMLLRAGYHRAFAYISAASAPREPFLAALTEHRLVELEIPGMRAKLSAASPPLVGDFLNPELVLPVKAARVRHQFKITVEMRHIPVE